MKSTQRGNLLGMAERRLRVKVCDRCDSTDTIRKLRLTDPETNRQATFDACLECRSTVPLVEWEKLLRKSPRQRTAGSVVVSGAVLEKARRG